jgi:signal transduction histidine kinase
MIRKKTIQAISGTTLFRYLRIWLKANTAIVISGFIVVSFLSFSVFQIVSLNETVMDTLEENGYKSYEAEIKSKVEGLIKELDELDRVYSKTDLTKSQKRELMLDFVGSKNFSDDNEEYFFVLKSDGSVLLSLLVQDGSKSGENAIALKDKNGKEYVKDIVEKASGGGGYVRYKLPKAF